MSKISYRPDIDGLRAVAVVPVVLHHAGFATVPGGFVGVDIFFVISGFLITRILTREIRDGQFSLLSFYERRARRILPALFAVLVACLAVGWFLLLPSQYDALARSTAATLLFVSNVWFWDAAGDYFGRGVELAPLLHTWSLAVEEQFYLGFPILLWLMAKQSRSFWVGVIAVISLISLGLSIWATTAAPIANFYLTPMRVWELGLGALLAIGAFPALRRPWAAEAIGLIGLVMIAGSIVLISEDTPFPGFMAVPPCAGAAFLIWAGMHGTSIAGRLLALRPVVWIGLISYSLYLWHWPILVAARVQNGSADLPVMTALACVLLSVLLAAASMYLIERPFRIPAGKGGFSRGRIFAGAGIGAALILGLAVTLVAKEGVPSRVPAELAAKMNKFKESHYLMDACRRWVEGEEPCKIGAPVQAEAGPRVVVWGDSHAGSLLPGINSWLKDNGIPGKAFVKFGCPALLGVRRADMAPVHGCDTYNEMVARYIEQLPDLDAVVVASRWALATEGVRVSGEEGKSAVLAASDERPTGIADNPKHVEQGLKRLLQRLRGRGIEVLIVGSIPEIGFNVPDALAGSAAFGTRLRVPPSREEFDHRNTRSYAILAAAGREFGVALARPADILCEEFCRIQLDGRPVYRDDDHLSEFGANWIMPVLLDQHLLQN
ncbi:acyltransferase family protein [Ruegeria meonggei]|uniref:acyltransferase family protein n=1 Tax=Ruegeria meonggei TaxID=1446476 RepID=UPI003672AF5B